MAKVESTIRRPSDQPQRDRAAGDLDTTFLVEAAAGTGKTTLLVDRILTIIRSGRATLREVAAITFTEKAAGELKVRLREEIEKTLQRGREAEPEKFRQALADLERMPVGTIHGFCGDLIRERPVEAGVAPGFGIADELTAGLLLDEVWQDWLASEMAKQDSPLRAAIEAGMNLRENAQGVNPLFALARMLVNWRDVLPGGVIEPAWTEERFDEAVESMRDKIEELDMFRASTCADHNDKLARGIIELAAWARRVPSSEQAETDWLRNLPKINKQFGTKKAWPDSSKQQAHELHEEIVKARDEILDEKGHRILTALVAGMEPFLARYAEEKAERRLLDFMDLLILARKMLAENAEARRHFKNAFRFMLVDEFQDTDPLQTEIVFFLCESLRTAAERWEDVELEPGKLFIVGDPKQSIYRFRRADLELYGRAKERIAAQGETLQLNVNFRSMPGVIRQINPIFAPLMTGPVNGHFEPMHVDLEPFRPEDSCGPWLFVARAPLIEAEMKVERWRLYEANLIAGCIKRMVASGELIMDKGGARPLQYRDCAVIYRYGNGLEQLEEACRAQDIPYQVAGGRHYYARQEFQDLLVLLKAIDNPYDGISVAGALRSPFFGHSDEDLLLHRMEGGALNYLTDVPKNFTRLNVAFQTLRRLHELRKTADASAVLEEIFASTQALQIYAMKPHGEQRVANLLKAQDSARALTRGGVGSFGEIVRWLATMESAGQGESEGAVAEPADDFVQLMTCHKAKGLEFPVVAVVQMTSENTQKDRLIFDRVNERLHLRMKDSLRTRGWQEAEEEEDERESHEERRLLYVALTRARNRLILPLYWDKSTASGPKGLLEFLAERFPEAEELPGEVASLNPEEFNLDLRARDAFRLRPALRNKLPPEAEEFWKDRTRWRADMLERTIALNDGLKATTPSEANRLAREAEPEAERRRAGKGARFGELVHLLLERVDYANPGDLEALARSEAPALSLAQADADSAAAMVRRALELPLFTERIRKAQAVYREMPFVVKLDDLLMEGRADLVLREPDGLVVVDYKSDRVTEAEAPDKALEYKVQGRAYAQALATATGLPVKEVIFLFLAPNVCVSIKLS